MSRSKRRRLEIQGFLEKKPLPVVLLAVDPGEEAGAAILEGDGSDMIVHSVEEVRTSTRELESVLEIAIRVAEEAGKKLYLCCEDWGAGGQRGIAQWQGLGAARGAWERAFLLEAPPRGVSTKTNSKFRVTQNTWRSVMINETGDTSSGKWKKFDSEGWKDAAMRAIPLHFPASVAAGHNSAEALLMAGYAIRSQDLKKKIPPTYLKRMGHVED